MAGTKMKGDRIFKLAVETTRPCVPSGRVKMQGDWTVVSAVDSGCIISMVSRYEAASCLEGGCTCNPKSACIPAVVAVVGGVSFWMARGVIAEFHIELRESKKPFSTTALVCVPPVSFSSPWAPASPPARAVLSVFESCPSGPRPSVGSSPIASDCLARSRTTDRLRSSDGMARSHDTSATKATEVGAATAKVADVSSERATKETRAECQRARSITKFGNTTDSKESGADEEAEASAPSVTVASRARTCRTSVSVADAANTRS
mmetsp:Transcript_25428/g.58825  ORF Transcript_25428/g.58825 Transcript_25428/m.58825 type:complete len:263 (+) Transcript_25428:378-1166(+)